MARWARVLSIANGPAALLVFLAYVFYSLALGLPAALLFPAYGIVLALYFRKAGVDTSSEDERGDRTPK